MLDEALPFQNAFELIDSFGSVPEKTAWRTQSRRRSSSPASGGFPAWTLYARVFSGNRTHADYLVEKALSGVRHGPESPATEAEVHANVLSSIRSSALRSWGAAVTAPPRSLLGLVLEPGHEELEGAQRDAARRLGQLTRGPRRSIERVLLQRPSGTLERVAARDGIPPAAVTAAIEDGLRHVAASVRRGGARLPASARTADEEPRHSTLEALVRFLQGALSADEARAVVSHGGRCPSCGDRLGAMMLLKAASIEALRVPRVPASSRRAGLGLLVSLALASGFFLVREMMPNPWGALATNETVPGWFYVFLYRSEGPRSGSEIAQGLSLIVEGRHEEAIEKLGPLVESDNRDPEATAYLGIARYLSGDSSRGTVRLLESGTSSSRSGRLARWYLASVLLSRGDVEGATIHLKELATVRDWFGRAAKALLEKLEERSEPEGTLVASAHLLGSRAGVALPAGNLCGYRNRRASSGFPTLRRAPSHGRAPALRPPPGT